MLEHDRAMGYATRLSPVTDIRLAAIKALKPPPSVLPLMETFVHGSVGINLPVLIAFRNQDGIARITSVQPGEVIKKLKS